MELPQRDQVLGWADLEVVDTSGETVGRVRHVYADEATDLPEWLVTELPDGGRAFVPLTDARQEGEELRRAAYALLDHVPADEQVEDRLALRGASLELVVRAATALVAATGGSAMGLDAAPQRLVREAVFHLVQAQTGPVRRATLERLLERTA